MGAWMTDLERSNAAGYSEAQHDERVQALREEYYGRCREQHPGTFYASTCTACNGEEYDEERLVALIADRDGDPGPLEALRQAEADAAKARCYWCDAIVEGAPVSEVAFCAACEA